MTEKSEFNKKVVEYNIYKAQLEQLVNELSVLNQTSSNLLLAKNTLENIQNLEGEPEILVPIGGNTFLKAHVKDTKNVLAGIGADIIVKKEVPDAISTIEKQLEELRGAKQKIEAQLKEFSERMGKLEPELEKMLEEARQKTKP